MQAIKKLGEFFGNGKGFKLLGSWVRVATFKMLKLIAMLIFFELFFLCNDHFYFICRCFNEQNDNHPIKPESSTTTPSPSVIIPH